MRNFRWEYPQMENYAKCVNKIEVVRPYGKIVGMVLYGIV